MLLTPEKPLQLAVYPRGFLGRPATMQIRPKVRTFGQRSGRRQTLELYQPAQNELVPDAQLMSVYRRWFNGEPSTRSYDYRREVMSLALQVFGTATFVEWYLAQEASPAYGDWHKRFLEDTIGYLCGEKRTLSLRTWMRMVTYQDEPANSAATCPHLGGYFGRHLNPTTISGVPLPVSLEENASLPATLQNWLAKPNGLDDMLGTLYILFGDLN